MQIQPFRAVYPNLKFIASPDSFFDTVKEDFTEYQKSGFFEQLPATAMYVYQIQTMRRNYTGLVAGADVEEFLEGKILKHENTLTSLEQVQLQLLFQRSAIVKPVLLTYPTVPEIDHWLHRFINSHRPFLEIHFDAENQHHLLWAVTEVADIQTVQILFSEKIPHSYIADGHHRTSTISLMYEKMKQELPDKYRYFFSTFFSFSELEIFDYNRVVQGLNDLTPTLLMAKLSRVFDIEWMEVLERPMQKHELVLFFNRESYRLRWRPEILSEYHKEPVILDAMLLNEKVLSDILGIADVRNDKRIKYIEGPKGIEGFKDLVQRGEHRVGFLMHPVAWEDFLTIAETGRIMPPKSTWFEPRMKNGILVQEM